METFTDSAHVHTEADYLPAPPSEIIVPASKARKPRKVTAIKPPSDTLFQPVRKAARYAAANACRIDFDRTEGLFATVGTVYGGDSVTVRFDGLNDRSLVQRLRATYTETVDLPIIDPASHEWQSLPADRFLTALEYVSRASSTDITRERLNGVFFGGALTTHAGDWCATDGHRLHLARDLPCLSGSDVIVPSWAIETVQRAGRWLRPESVQVTLVSDVSIAFRLERAGSSAVVVARLIDGQFPEYRQVIPTIDAFTAGNPTFSTMVASGKALTDAFKFAPKRGIDKGAAYDLSVGETLRVTPTTGEHYPLPAQACPAPTGGAWSVALNARYLAESVEGVDGVALQFIDDRSPVRIDADMGGLSLTAVVMPMRR